MSLLYHGFQLMETRAPARAEELADTLTYIEATYGAPTKILHGISGAEVAMATAFPAAEIIWDRTKHGSEVWFGYPDTVVARPALRTEPENDWSVFGGPDPDELSREIAALLAEDQAVPF